MAGVLPDPAAARNIALFGHLAHLPRREPPFPLERRRTLLALHELWRFDFRNGLLPWQVRDAMRRRASHSPVIPMQRTKTAALKEQRVFELWPRQPRPPEEAP